MRVVLADDDARMREALRSLLAEHPDIDVVGDAADGHAALPRVRVIGLSLHADRHFIAAMRAAGASGYLRKDRIH
jgi:DNA-binding NarL/FixJ family response regulator